MFYDWFQLAVVRQVLRREIGLKIMEVESEKANVEGGDVLWTGNLFISIIVKFSASYLLIV